MRLKLTICVLNKKDYYIAFNNRGLAKLGKKDYEGAIKDFNKAISLKNDYAFAFNNRCFCIHIARRMG